MLKRMLSPSMRPRWPRVIGRTTSFIFSSSTYQTTRSLGSRGSGSVITYMNFQTREQTAEKTSTNLKDRYKESKLNSGKTVSQHHNQLRTEIEGQNKKKNRKSDVISAISMDIQRRIVSPPAGTVIFLAIATEIVLKEKIEEEVRAEEKQEEEMSLLLDKEDGHLKEGNIPLIQKENQRKRKTEVIGLE